LSLALKFNFAEQVYAKIKEAIAKSSPNDFRFMVVGARFAADYGVYLNDAFKWIDKAISIEKNFTCYFQKARLYYVAGKYIDALKEIERCRDAGRNDSDYSSHLGEIDILEQRIKSKF
jgi:tetratricopeptide (TPR) repeat protein